MPIARLTPACAGRLKYFSRFVSDQTTHPRLHGDDLSHFNTIIGSSEIHPRLRGDDGKSKPKTDLESSIYPRLRGDDNMMDGVRVTNARFTPACAGTTSR